MTISVLYIVQFHAGKKRRAAQWKLCCGILIKLESLKRGKRKSLQWAIFKAKNLKRIRTGRYAKWTEIHQSPPKHAFEGWGEGGWEGTMERVHSPFGPRWNSDMNVAYYLRRIAKIMTFFFFLWSISPPRFFNLLTCAPCVPGGGVLPYITYTGMCRPTGSWFWSSWFRTGYSFQRRFLERGIKNCGSRLYLLLKIVADYEEAFIWCISRTNKEISF